MVVGLCDQIPNDEMSKESGNIDKWKNPFFRQQPNWRMDFILMQNDKKSNWQKKLKLRKLRATCRIINIRPIPTHVDSTYIEYRADLLNNRGQ